MVDISIVNGIINQLITGGHHLVSFFPIISILRRRTLELQPGGATRPVGPSLWRRHRLGRLGPVWPVGPPLRRSWRPGGGAAGGLLGLGQVVPGECSVEWSLGWKFMVFSR